MTVVEGSVETQVVPVDSFESPEGWAICSVREIVAIRYGKALKESNRAGGPIPVYGSNGVVGSHDIPLTNGPAIVVGRKGSVGIVHRSDVACWPIDTTYYIDDFGAINDEYLTYALRSLNLAEQDTSTAIPGLNREDIYRQRIPLPPIAEQSRIVSRVAELLERVHAVDDRLRRVPAILKRFRQSVLAAACSGQLTADWREENPDVETAAVLVQGLQASGKQMGMWEQSTGISELPPVPDTWLWTQIRDVADVQGGIQKQPKRAPRSNASPYLRVANVQRGRLDLSELKFMELFGGELDVYRLEVGDLLVVEGNGSLSEIGRSAIWSGSVQDCVHQNHIIRVRLRGGVPEYLNIYWNSPTGTQQVSDVAVTTAGLYSLSTKKVAGLPVPFPPLEEQAEVVRRVNALFNIADSVERSAARVTTRTVRLTQAILAKAFSGELVPIEAVLARNEGRDYETAEALLERIARERGEASVECAHLDVLGSDHASAV